MMVPRRNWKCWPQAPHDSGVVTRAGLADGDRRGDRERRPDGNIANLGRGRRVGGAVGFARRLDPEIGVDEGFRRRPGPFAESRVIDIAPAAPFLSKAPAPISSCVDDEPFARDSAPTKRVRELRHVSQLIRALVRCLHALAVVSAQDVVARHVHEKAPNLVGTASLRQDVLEDRLGSVAAPSQPTGVGLSSKRDPRLGARPVCDHGRRGAAPRAHVPSSDPR